MQPLHHESLDDVIAMACIFSEKYVHLGYWLLASIVIALGFSQLGCLASPTSVAEGAVREGVGVELWASERCPRIGETVTLRAKVTNQSTSALVAELKDQPVLDIIITDKEGQHRWSVAPHSIVVTNTIAELNIL